ncbi:hypothetical protein EBX93_16715 [bacterium]|nr:hypothetical protein [bacterium]
MVATSHQSPPLTLQHKFLKSREVFFNSHCDFSAFHSGTDQADESTFDGIHITLGHVNRNDFSIVASLAFSDNRFPKAARKFMAILNILKHCKCGMKITPGPGSMPLKADYCFPARRFIIHPPRNSPEGMATSCPRFPRQDCQKLLTPGFNARTDDLSFKVIHNRRAKNPAVFS